MKLLRLEFQAFLSYKDKQEIDFEKFSNSLFLIDGDTGAGKTTIFDAIVFALFGEASDKARDRNFRSHYAENDKLCYVRLTFEEEGKIVEVYREPAQNIQSKKRDKDGNYPLVPRNASCELTIDGHTYTKITECNIKIKEIIKLDQDQFRNTIMIGQNKFADLIRSSTKDRKELFRSILNTHNFDNFKMILAKKYSEESKKVSESNTRIDTILKNYQTEDEKLASKLSIDKPSLNDFDMLSSLIDNDIKCLEVKYNESNKEKETYNKLCIDLNNELTKSTNDNAHLARYKEHQAKFDELKNSEEYYDSIKKIIDTYDDSQFSFTKYNTYKENENNLNEKKASLDKNTKELAELAPQIKIAKAYLDEKENLEEANIKYRDKLKDLYKLVDDFNKLSEELKNKETFNNNINGLNVEIKEKESCLEKLNNEIKGLTSYNEENKETNVKIEKLNNEIDNNKKIIDTLSNYLNQYNNYQDLDNTLKINEIKNKEHKASFESKIEELTLLTEGMNEYIKEYSNIELRQVNNSNDIKEVNNKLSNLNSIKNKYKLILKEQESIKDELSKINELTILVDFKKNEYNHKELEYKANIVGLIAKDLIEGTPCPVCGSTHHTKPALKSTSVSESDVKVLLDEYTSLNDKLSKLKGTNDEHVKHLKEALDSLVSELNKLGVEGVTNTNIEDSIKSYELFLEHKLTELKELTNTLTDTLNQVNKNKEQLETYTKEIELFKESIKEIDLSIAADTSKRGANLDNINNLIKDISLYINNINKDNLVDLINKELSELKDKLDDILLEKESLNKIASTIKDNQNNINILNVKSDEINTKVNELNMKLTSTKTNLDTCVSNIDELNKSLNGLSIIDINKQIEDINKTINDNLVLIKKYDDYYLVIYNQEIKLNNTINLLNKDIEKLEDICTKLNNELTTLLNSSVLKDINKIVDYCNNYKDTIDNIKIDYSNYLSKVNVAKSLLDEDIKNSYDKLIFKDLEELKNNIDINTIKYKEIDNIVIDLNSKLNNNKQIYSNYKKIYESVSSLSIYVSDLKKLNDVASGQVNGKEKIDFETYYQSQVFNNILAQANKKLNIMTDNVYSMIRHESSDEKGSTALDIDIFDTNTGKVRSANSLSGGEIFMASLSLALGFSEISKTNSGSHELDCMFIDEGFGTLDEETLRTVMRALNQLSNEANRTIGIISHVSELRDVIRKQIHVTKDKVSGSKMEIID